MILTSRCQGRSLEAVNLCSKREHMYLGRIPENVDAGGAIAEAAPDQSRAESRGAHHRHSGSRQEPMGPFAQR